LALAYDRYFASGRYDRRYPRPNPVVMRAVRRWASCRNPDLIDFGCGSGRYTLAFAPFCRSIVGYDVCATALSRAEQARGQRGAPANVHFADPGVFSAACHRAAYGPADMALAIFGVIAHIENDDERTAALVELRRAVRAGSGRAVISVPNRRRRFRREQRRGDGDPTRVVYERHLPAERIRLFYRLYDSSTLRRELEHAGFEVLAIMAESTLPERLVAGSALARLFERMLTPLVPADAGYGLLAVAQRPAADDDAGHA